MNASDVLSFRNLLARLSKCLVQNLTSGAIALISETATSQDRKVPDSGSTLASGLSGWLIS